MGSSRSSLSEVEDLVLSPEVGCKTSDYGQLNWILESEKSHSNAHLPRIPRENLRFAFITIFTVVAMIAGFLYFMSTPTRDQRDVWLAYPVAGSQGPLVQLRIEGSNSSEWVSSHSGHLENFAFRIDDQTLVPKELLSSPELRYQAWFRKFYPQLWDVYRDGQYLDGDYLAAASANMIHVDLRFHLSHCVLALRRYWTAKESGKHVCARDLDPGHIEHCLNSLDEWAFPENGVPPKHNVWLQWITQVCEYES